jgi:hypothetical protein
MQRAYHHPHGYGQFSVLWPPRARILKLLQQAFGSRSVLEYPPPMIEYNHTGADIFVG